MSLKVKDVMSKPPIVVSPNITLSMAAQEMIRHGVSFLVICKDKRLYGVLSEKDIVKAVSEGLDPCKVKVDDVCTKTVITIREDESLQIAAKLMRINKIRHLVVVDEQLNVVGVLSIRDLLREEKLLQKIEYMRPEGLNK